MILLIIWIFLPKSLQTNIINKKEEEMFRNFSQDFLIEEYLSGMVVSVDGFIQNKKI